MVCTVEPPVMNEKQSHTHNGQVHNVHELHALVAKMV